MSSSPTRVDTVHGRRPLVDAVQAELRALSTEIDHLDALAAERFGLNRTDLRCLDLRH
jgi:hypothetical protein